MKSAKLNKLGEKLFSRDMCISFGWLSWPFSFSRELQEGPIAPIISFVVTMFNVGHFTFVQNNKIE